MPEHVCEWAIISYFAECRLCPEQLSFDEMERRVNATEQLSAETAIGASVTVSAEHQSKALLAYAAELEEE